MSTPKYQSGGFISVFQPQKWEDDRPTTVIFFQSGGSTTSYEQVWKIIGGLAHPSIHLRTEKNVPEEELSEKAQEELQQLLRDLRRASSGRELRPFQRLKTLKIWI